MIHGLKTLVCNNCPLFKNIPKIQGLKKFECHGCPLVTVIPTFEDIREFYCGNSQSLTNIQSLDSVPVHNTDGCKWLNVNNPGYGSNIEKLIRLQKWFKQLILSQRLTRLIPFGLLRRPKNNAPILSSSI